MRLFAVAGTAAVPFLVYNRSNFNPGNCVFHIA